MIDLVERSGQIRVHHPYRRPSAPHGHEGGLDRVLAAPARSKPIRSGPKPGLPFPGFEAHRRSALPAPDRR